MLSVCKDVAILLTFICLLVSQVVLADFIMGDILFNDSTMFIQITVIVASFTLALGILIALVFWVMCARDIAIRNNTKGK